VKAAQKAVDLMEAMDRFNGHGRYQLKVRIGTDTPEGKGRLSGRRQGIFDL
jgi:hypothetical protein